jgi:hypothetical protein
MAIFPRFRNYLQRAERWYLMTPDRALDEAYDAALAIRAIEEQHFRGEKIGSSGDYNANTKAYFNAELKRYLKIIRMRLIEFRGSRATIDVTSPESSLYRSIELAEDYAPEEGRFLPPESDRIGITLEKLKFIDEVQSRYAPTKSQKNQALVSLDEQKSIVEPNRNPINQSNGKVNNKSNQQLSRATEVTSKNMVSRQLQIAANAPKKKNADVESITDKTGVLPRSILSTIGRLKRDLDPQSAIEAAELQRLNYAKTFISVRFVLVIVSLTLLAQLSTRYLFLSNQLPPGRWISEHYSAMRPQNSIFINGELEEAAFKELANFEEKLKFRNLLSSAFDQAPLSPEEIETQVQQKAKSLAKSFGNRSADAVKNWIADLTGLVVFCLILLNSSREVEVLKSFMDELVYGLSDSAKAFIIILLTDIFVGFHSPHGWEIMLEGIAGHLGLPANRNFIFLFIATFPVILDTIFKYWIFRYLNRVSPSAVATYKEMNE